MAEAISVSIRVRPVPEGSRTVFSCYDNTTITVNEPVDWETGDEIVITSTSWDQLEAEELTVVSVSGDGVLRQCSLEPMLASGKFLFVEFLAGDPSSSFSATFRVA